MARLSMIAVRLVLTATAAAGFLCLSQIPAAAQSDVVVDIELVLAVDISRSVSKEELIIQRDGYAAALTDPGVLSAIGKGLHQKIAITYVEWAGVETQRTVIPWTVISSPGDAAAIADLMRARPLMNERRTSISTAIDYSSGLFADNGITGLKRVIDISGDGPNNQGRPVADARDEAVAKGIIINGLPLLTSNGPYSVYDIPDLDRFYADCVTGGPGSFVVSVNDWSQFPAAVRRKLILELAGSDPEPGLPLVLAAEHEPYDCLAGEKLWDSRVYFPDMQ